MVDENGQVRREEEFQSLGRMYTDIKDGYPPRVIFLNFAFSSPFFALLVVLQEPK